MLVIPKFDDSRSLTVQPAQKFSHKRLSRTSGKTSRREKPTSLWLALFVGIFAILTTASGIPPAVNPAISHFAAGGADPCEGLTPTISGTAGNDIVSGTPGDDIIFTYGGFDQINAGDGDDIICSGEGKDIVRGGAGNDVIHDVGGVSYLQGNAGNDTIVSGLDGDFLYGQSGNDVLIALGGKNRIYGGTGDDSISAGSGDDLLAGHAGADTIDAGEGNDSITGGGGPDVLNSGAGNDNSNGQGGDDELNGEDGDDNLVGGHGSDTLRGGAGNDVCNGNVQPGDVDNATDCETNLNVSSEGPQEAPKLILYVMLDDADYHDVGYNSTDSVTPNIDALRDDGVTLDNFYASSGICSPTRASVLTGNSPGRYGLSRLWPDTSSLNTPTPPDAYFSSLRGLPENIPLVSDISEEGYKSFHIGKWHVGDSQESYLPNAQGFDKSIIMKASPYEGALQAKVDGTWERTAPQTWRPQYMADEIVDYIDENKANDKMFVNWWAIAPHTPLYVPPGFDNAEHNFDLDSNRGKLLATLNQWDHEFGRVVTHLKDEGLYDDSLIIFTSDNGGYKQALNPDREVSGSKNTLSEGGIRVPFVATWPNGLPAGVTRSTAASTHDILPTLFEAAGRQIPSGLDGSSFLPELKTDDETDRPPIFWQLRTRSWRTATKSPGGFDPANLDPTFDDRAFDTYALRDGCYKVVRESSDPVGNVDQEPFKLYNVCTDLSESNDLRLSNPALFNQMKSKLLNRRKEVALLPMIPDDIASGGTTIPYDSRLDTHQDDLSFYTTVNDYNFGEVKDIYSRGEGLSVQLDASGKLTVKAKGTTDKSRSNPEFKTVQLEHQLSSNQTSFKVGLVIHNYWSHAATLELYVDDVLVDEVLPPFVTAATRDQVGDSIYAIRSSDDDLTLGDSGISLTDTAFYVTALRPDEL